LCHQQSQIHLPAVENKTRQVHGPFADNPANHLQAPQTITTGFPEKKSALISQSGFFM